MSPSTDMSKAACERLIFADFASRYLPAVAYFTIDSREPPEPDIHCKMNSGQVLRFELVEVLDSAIVRNMDGNVAIRDALNSRASAASIPVLSTPGVLVHLRFRSEITDNKKRAAVAGIVIEASQVPSGFSGRWAIRDKALRAVLEWMQITRGGEFDSEFALVDGTSFADPLLQSIHGKLGKHYEPDEPRNLLAYYDAQPCLVGDWNRGPVATELFKLVRGGQFSRVWVYSVREKCIYWAGSS